MSNTRNHIRIKFCGMTRAEDAQLAAELGVDYAGFVMVPDSARAVSPQAAQAIAQTLPASIQAVALFQNAGADAITTALQVFSPTLLQFHGRESATFCASFGLPWVKAVPMGESQDYAAWEHDYAAAAALLADSHTTAGGGGSGHGFAWAQLPQAAARHLPLLLAGGLTAETVADAIHAVRPWGVDVSSGIEGSTKGLKDHRKMRAFVEAVRLADESLKHP